MGLRRTLRPPAPGPAVWALALATAIWGIAPGVARGAEAQAPTSLRPVQTCLERNLPGRSSRQSVRFRRIDRLGAARVSQAEILWRRFGEEGAEFRARVRFRAPVELRGTSVLMVRSAPDAEVLVWLPELAEVRRLRGTRLGDTIFGTDFSFEDLERVVMGHSRGEARRRPDATLEGRDAWVLETRPEPGSDSSYRRMVSYVDQRTCVPVRVELYEPADRLRKLMKVPVPRIERRGSRWVPTLVLMRDLVEETHTELIVDSVAVDVELSKALFSEEALPAAPEETP